MYGEGNEHFQNPVSVIFTLFFMRFIKSYQQVQFNLTFVIWAFMEIWTQCRFVIAWEVFFWSFSAEKRFKLVERWGYVQNAQTLKRYIFFYLPFCLPAYFIYPFPTTPLAQLTFQFIYWKAPILQSCGHYLTKL